MRSDIALLCTETEQLLDSWNILVHSVITGCGQDHDKFAMANYDPRRDTATVVSSEVVARHAEYFRAESPLLPGSHQGREIANLASRRAAIWVAVHRRPARFTGVCPCRLTCGANAYEPRRTRSAQALNPQILLTWNWWQRKLTTTSDHNAVRPRPTWTD